MTRQTEIVTADRRSGCLPYLLVIALVIVFWAAVFGAGAWLGASLSDPPVCEEDEVILSDGRCFPLDDAEYLGGVGWVDITHART